MPKPVQARHPLRTKPVLSQRFYPLDLRIQTDVYSPAMLVQAG